jgi:hypothetical protein
MAKVLASRAPSDEAFQERLERAAARFPSIHERWSGVTHAVAHEAVAGDELEAAQARKDGEEEVAGPISESAVGVAPILGIAEAEDEPRPRFKTLMGVPRDAPDVDEQASFATPALQEPHASGQSAAPARERPRPPPVPAQLFASPPVFGARSVSAPATAQPARDTLPPAFRSNTTFSPAAGQAEFATELSALRRTQRRRSWLVGMASFAATLAVFALAAPRERALAFRWLLDEYQQRAQPSLHAVADSARALKPSSLVEPRATSPSPASSATEPIEEVPAVEPRRDPEIDMPVATTATAAEVAREPRSAAPTEPVSRAQSEEAQHAAAGGEVPSDGSAPPAQRAAQREGVASRASAQVAAPRQRSARTTAKTSAATKTSAGVKPRAARSTKERSTRQNSSRRGGNGGIIRETPF